MTESPLLCYGPRMSNGKNALLFESLLYRARDPETLESYYRHALGVDRHFTFRRATGAGRNGEAGLFHTAFRYETRRDLAVALLRLHALGAGFEGAGDHDVSEAIYLSDPEGNGIEIYADRPREEWRFQAGNLQMRTLPLDMEDLLREVPEKTRNAASDFRRGAAASVQSLANRAAALPAELAAPATATLGHLHLRVLDLPGAESFWKDRIGLEVTARYGEVASFLAAGGYHHHIGLNRFGPWVPRTPGGPGPEAVTIAVNGATEGEYPTPEGIEVRVRRQ